MFRFHLLSFARNISTKQAPSNIKFKKLVAATSSNVLQINTAELEKKLLPSAECKSEKQATPCVKPLLIDVRETTESLSGVIPNSVLIPKGLLEARVEQYSTQDNQEIILYSSSGGRSILAAEALKRMGYKNVKSLKGGINEWKNKNLPLLLMN